MGEKKDITENIKYSQHLKIYCEFTEITSVGVQRHTLTALQMDGYLPLKRLIQVPSLGTVSWEPHMDLDNQVQIG